MNLKQLEVFVAVVETGSFTLGAEKTYLTQSTVSQHISSLESEFGLRLLDRTGKGVYLTEGGRIFHDFACRILSGTRDMTTAIQRYKGLEQAVLRIGCSNIPGTYLIPRFLPQYHALHPGVSVHVVQGDSHEILEKLKNNEIEIGFLGSLYSDDAIIFDEIARDSIMLSVNKDHKWRGVGSISVEDLPQATFVLREDGSGTQKTVGTALKKAGIETECLQIAARLGSNEAVKQAVIHGVGVAFLSEISIRNACRRRELFPVHVRGLAINRHFYCAGRRGREPSPAARSFLNHSARWFQEERHLS